MDFSISSRLNVFFAVETLVSLFLVTATFFARTILLHVDGLGFLSGHAFTTGHDLLYLVIANVRASDSAVAFSPTGPLVRMAVLEMESPVVV